MLPKGCISNILDTALRIKVKFFGNFEWDFELNQTYYVYAGSQKKASAITYKKLGVLS